MSESIFITDCQCNGGGSQGGTTDYNDLSHKPLLGGNTLQGNTPLRTVGGQNLIGQGNIPVGCTIPVETTLPARGELLPNVLYKLGEISGNMEICFATPTDNTVANIWCLTFDIGSSVPTIAWMLTLQYMWADGAAPALEANTHYEVSCMDKLILVSSAAIPHNPLPNE